MWPAGSMLPPHALFQHGVDNFFKTIRYSEFETCSETCIKYEPCNITRYIEIKEELSLLFTFSPAKIS